MAEKIVIVNYDPAWPAMFEQERARLLAALDGHVTAVEHIGSTSVPGLGAKPIIDILIGVQRLADADTHCIQPIVGLGYEYVQAFERETPFRRYFRKNSPEGVRTHHIHLVETGSPWWLEHLAFRDYLRSHADVRQDYERLKRKLTKREWERGSDYAEAKTEFVRQVLDMARRLGFSPP